MQARAHDPIDPLRRRRHDPLGTTPPDADKLTE
jgi:hypothetical protein